MIALRKRSFHARSIGSILPPSQAWVVLLLGGTDRGIVPPSVAHSHSPCILYIAVYSSLIVPRFGPAEFTNGLFAQLHPITPIRSIAHGIQASAPTPFRHGRAIHVQQDRDCWGRVAPVAALSQGRAHRLARACGWNPTTVADAVHFVVREWLTSTGLPPLLVQDVRNLPIAVRGRKRTDPLHDLRIRAVFLTRPQWARHCVLGDHSTLPADTDVNRLLGQRQGHIVDEQPQQLFALRLRRRRRLPDRRHISGQIENLLLFLRTHQ